MQILFQILQKPEIIQMKNWYTIVYGQSSVYGPGSVVGIVTGYRLGWSGDRIPVGARFSAPIKTGPGAHPASCTMGTRSSPGVKSGQGMTLSPSSAVVKKEQSYTSTPPMGRTASTEPQCLCKGALYHYFLKFSVVFLLFIGEE